MKRALPSIAFALLLAACCESGVKAQESSYKYRRDQLAQVEAKASVPTKDEIRKRREDIETRYAALPPDEASRGEGLGKLNQELSKAISDYETRVNNETTASANALRDVMLKELEGTWLGGGVTLTIQSSGAMSYEKKTGATTKSLTGTISKIDEHSFEAGALGITTTFKIDKRPFVDGAARKMVIDGTELSRK